MKTKNYTDKQLMEMFGEVIENPYDVRIVCELKRTHTETWCGKTEEWNDYYMFDLSCNGEPPMYDKFQITLCNNTYDTAFDATLGNAYKFLQALVRHNKVERVYVESF